MQTVIQLGTNFNHARSRSFNFSGVGTQEFFRERCESIMSRAGSETKNSHLKRSQNRHSSMQSSNSYSSFKSRNRHEIQFTARQQDTSKLSQSPPFRADREIFCVNERYISYQSSQEVSPFQSYNKLEGEQDFSEHASFFSYDLHNAINSECPPLNSSNPQQISDSVDSNDPTQHLSLGRQKIVMLLTSWPVRLFLLALIYAFAIDNLIERICLFHASKYSDATLQNSSNEISPSEWAYISNQLYLIYPLERAISESPDNF